MQLDIDSILQRRSRTVVHENTGSSSGAAGGTFSKASFKSSVGSGMSGNAEDIDIEDPDFWKKMIGEPKADEDMDILLTKTRTRRQITSYSELEYNKQLENVLGNSDSGSDGNYQSDDDDASDLASGKERVRWGGSRPSEWKKEDAESVAIMLSTIGYGRIPWEEFKTLLPFTKPYEISDVSILKLADCSSQITISHLQYIDQANVLVNNSFSY